MRHETGLSLAVAKKHFCRALDQFLCICAPNCPFERPKYEAVSDETG